MPPAHPRVGLADGWTITGTVACRSLACIDLAAPAAGLVTGGGDHLLGLDLRAEPRLVDHWVRGDDLVAAYEPSDPRRLRATASWRPLPGSAWEAVVSAQTSILESDPAMAVTCDVAAGTIAWGREDHGRIVWTPLAAGAACPPEATCLVLHRPADALVVAVHPAAMRRITVHLADGRLRLECWLFPSAVEKGVLLRSRVLAATGPAGDDSWAAAVALGLAASPPPLSS